MVAAALYLACKVEEQPKSLSKVSEAVYSTAFEQYPRALSLLMKQVSQHLVKNPEQWSDDAFLMTEVSRSQGGICIGHKLWPKMWPIFSSLVIHQLEFIQLLHVKKSWHAAFLKSLAQLQETFLLLKQRVLIAERALLYVLGFNMEVQHASQIGVDYLQKHYNALLPKEMRVSPEVWEEQCSRQDGPSFNLMNQLCDLTWQLFLLRWVPSILRDAKLHLWLWHWLRSLIYLLHAIS